MNACKIPWVMRYVAALLLALLAMPLLAASPRIAFWRTIPAEHPLPATGNVSIVYADDQNERPDSFLEELVDHVNRRQIIRLRDVSEKTQGSSRMRIESIAARLQHEPPSAAHLGLDSLICATVERQGEASFRNADGRRAWQSVSWLEATCSARIDILTSPSLEKIDTFVAKGEGQSPKQPKVDGAMGTAAIDSALRNAARAASEAITPRRMREWIVLDETSPVFTEAMTMIETSRLAAARSLWENAMKSAPSSAALRFNLGAVCEALGDVTAAGEHYRAAVRMRPAEPRYALEHEAYRRRQNLVRTR